MAFGSHGAILRGDLSNSRAAGGRGDGVQEPACRRGQGLTALPGARSRPRSAERDWQAAVEDRDRAPAELGSAHEGNARAHGRVESGRDPAHPELPAGIVRAGRGNRLGSPTGHSGGAPPPQLAQRRAPGELPARGSRRIAERIGGGSGSFAMQVKGLEMAIHEPRGKVGVALGYATNEAGADHLVAFHDPIFVNAESVAFKGAIPLGITEPTGALDLGEKKVGIWYTGERWNSAEKVLGLCFFGPAPRSFMQVDDVIAAVRAATGWARRGGG